ncbi:MAG TPA: VOC family protein [Lacunisphaera sp.]|jgi:catechol 2,3-dioxygenase-like lactoylglutathione lyase family enzyme
MTTPTSIRVVAFAFTGYPVTDLVRARGFYEGVLGLKPGTAWEGDGKGWIEYELGDATLAITNSGGDSWRPSDQGPCVALEVTDFAATVAALRAARVTFVNEPLDFPSCNLAAIQDPDGNRLVIHKKKATT